MVTAEEGILRYETDGSLDTYFGDDGLSDVMPGTTIPADIDVGPGGRIYVSATHDSLISGTKDFLVAEIQEGTPFGGAGGYTTPGPRIPPPGLTGSNELAGWQNTGSTRDAAAKQQLGGNRLVAIARPTSSAASASKSRSVGNASKHVESGSSFARPTGGSRAIDTLFGTDDSLEIGLLLPAVQILRD